MPRRRHRPELASQLRFLRGRLPLFLLGFGILLFQMWKVLVTQELEGKVFAEQRICASYEGELRLLKTHYQQLSSYARVEHAGRQLGLVWPEQEATRIVLASGQGERLAIAAGGARP